MPNQGQPWLGDTFVICFCEAMLNRAKLNEGPNQN